MTDATQIAADVKTELRTLTSLVDRNDELAATATRLENRIHDLELAVTRRSNRDGTGAHLILIVGVLCALSVSTRVPGFFLVGLASPRLLRGSESLRTSVVSPGLLFLSGVSTATLLVMLVVSTTGATAWTPTGGVVLGVALGTIVDAMIERPS